MIRFFITGIPKAMSIGGHVAKNPKTGQLFTTKRNEEWGAVVGQVGRTYAPPVPFEGPVSILIRFWLPKPKSAPLTRPTLPLTRPDIDNLFHKLTDQFNGVYWRDDAQIVDTIARRRYAERDEPTGLEVFIVRGPLCLLVVGEGAVLVQDDD